MGTPSSRLLLTDTTPASSEAWVPQMTRLSTSRPISSVPNQCSAEGGLRSAPQLVAMGSCGAIQAANTASTMKASTMHAPTIALRLWVSLRSARRQGPERGLMNADAD